VSLGGLSAGPEPDDARLSDAEWRALLALEAQLDLEGPSRRALEVRDRDFIHRMVVWLWWLLDPNAEGLPMPRLRRRPVRAGPPQLGV
jgi:hypothetical protein